MNKIQNGRRVRYAMLPKDHRPYTDKYFLRTKEILVKERLNPRVGIKISAYGEGKVSGLAQLVSVLQAYAPMHRLEVWVKKKADFTDLEPLAIIKGPVQDLVELETMYLGVLSDSISRANGLQKPDFCLARHNMKQVCELLGVPVTYFGARHYHWMYDADLAKAALLGGAVQTSTDVGSSNINKDGVGTMPHILVVVLASKYGIEKATLRQAHAKGDSARGPCRHIRKRSD
jgi:nicotinate phosphoribosyltransferase